MPQITDPQKHRQDLQVENTLLFLYCDKAKALAYYRSRVSAKAKALDYYMGRTAGSSAKWDSPVGMAHLVAMDFSPLAVRMTHIVTVDFSPMKKKINN